MSSAHTPGPWRASACCTQVTTSAKGRLDARDRVAEVRNPMKGINENAANARLIAAAPELLEALKRLARAYEADSEVCPDMSVQTAYETNSEAHRQARAAIAKATGRDHG